MSTAHLLREPFKLALSMTLFYWLALSMDWDMPKYGGLAIVLISLSTAGASLQKGVLRIVGTTVGLAVGMLGLALFSQDRWLNLLYFSVYLVVIGYFMPTSRYAYAWFVAGFLGPLVWASTYGNVDSAFHYATFRYLETTAGIIVYTIVSVLLWPRRAGDDLDRQGSELWPGLQQLLGLYRRRLQGGERPEEASGLQSRLAGVRTQMAGTLQAACADTPSVRARRDEWTALLVDARAICDALELWRESIDDCRRMDLSRLLPRLDEALDRLDLRLARISELWRARTTGAEVPAGAKDGTLESVRPELDQAAAAVLAPFDRAALLAFTRQLRVLDEVSLELLRAMRSLAGLDPGARRAGHVRPPELYRPARWDPLRLVNAVFPALCFALAYLFWIAFDPPTGPNVPNMAATFALMTLLTPMRALKLLPVMLAAILFAVAPVYFLVMPRLDTGLGLLLLIFCYTFAFGLIGKRSPAVMTFSLALFVMMTGINNDQSYSFLGLANGAMMIALPILIIAVVQILLVPRRPEQVLVQGVRRFFRGCALITHEFASRPPGRHSRARAIRKRLFQSMVAPVPQRLRAVEKRLDHELFPENGPDRVRRLLDALQSIVLRLQALELAYGRATRHRVAWSAGLAAIAGQIRERIEGVFHGWSRLDPTAAVNERVALRELGRSLEAHLDGGPEAAGTGIDDEALADLYAMLGCARGLVRSVAEGQAAAREINWDQWTEARF